MKNLTEYLYESSSRYDLPKAGEPRQAGYNYWLIEDNGDEVLCHNYKGNYIQAGYEFLKKGDYESAAIFDNFEYAKEAYEIGKKMRQAYNDGDYSKGEELIKKFEEAMKEGKTYDELKGK